MSIITTTIIILPIVIGMIVGLTFLQIYLSKKESKIPGLILPSIFFILSVFYSVPNFQNALNFSFSPGAFFASLMILLIYNVPTIIYVLIYLHLRNKINKASEINKMNVQDLD
ncbi:MAG: hypothetical protein AAGU14_06905 [Eubacteriaceae bacterium]